MKAWVLIFFFTSFLKLILFHSYHSTDFEVHRNWLAITHSLPVSQWYYDTTSQWTLDYPPFFAYFEYVMSQVAALVDQKIVELDNLEYNSVSVQLFQRVSVIVSDAVLCYACSQATSIATNDQLAKPLLTLLYMFNAGLLIVDHVHFQYNGLLSGLFLLSLVNAVKHDILWSAFYFTTLLNFKHIYLYVAPAYFVYMLHHYCCGGKGLYKLDITRLIGLGGLVVSVCAVSLGPFLHHLPQVISRLFPVSRGLCHAYWAPNLWALYNTADIGLSKLAKLAGVINATGTHPLMSGLVQTSSNLLLPNILPLHTAILTLLAMCRPLYRLWYNPSIFLHTVTLCAYISYMFGFHVHEKAILIVLVPAGLEALLSKREGSDYLMLSLIGTCSLFPLLFQAQECLLKVVIFVLTQSALGGMLSVYHGPISFFFIEKMYLGVLGLMQPVCWWLLPAVLPNLSFLPLMIISIYCAVGNIYCFVKSYVVEHAEHSLRGGKTYASPRKGLSPKLKSS